MNTLALAGMVAPTVLATCCAATDARGRRLTVVVPSLLMLAAMLDSTFARVVPEPFWAAALVVASMVSIAAGRFELGGGGGGAGAPRTLDSMQLHRAVSGIVMAGMLLVGAASGFADGSVEAVSSSHRGGHGGGGLAAFTVVAAAGAVALGMWSSVHSWTAGRDRRRVLRALAAAEPMLMSTAVVMMHLLHR